MTVSSAMRKFSEIISTIDCLYCFSEYANIDNLTRPKMTSKPILEISQGRHPILGQTIQNFIPNDCFLKSSMEPASTALITGPNMAGKSTYLRQNALIILLAQAGSFVPAKKAVIGITDRIFTRIGSGDDLHQDRSTFMVEMSESATILNQATLHSFIILDEIGRGTSTLDGLAIAWSFTEAISSIEARCLFATHYHELTDVAEKNNQLCNLNIVVRESGDNVVFIHRIAPGTAQGSYGIHVAKIAGIPEKTIQRAREILNNLNIQTDSSENSYSQPFLFCETDSELSKKILNINLDSLSPLEAFDEFRQLQKYAEDINNKK